MYCLHYYKIDRRHKVPSLCGRINPDYFITVLDDAVNDVTQGVDDVTDDVTDGIDDVTDDVTDGVDNAADDLTDENGAKKEGDRMKNTDQGDATGNADDSMR